jgi:thiol-disulfide isomerase/thioredoxin
MKILAALFVLVAFAFAQTPGTPAPAPAAADPELQEIVRLSRDSSVFQQAGLTPRERRLAYDAANVAFVARARAYIAGRAAGPERAEAVLALVGRGAQFITAIDPAFDGNPQGIYITFDEEKRKAFEAESLELLAGVRADATATAAQRTQAGRALLVREMSRGGTAAELDALQQRIEQLAGEGLDERSLMMLQTRMFHPYAMLGVTAYAAYLDRVADSPVAALRPHAVAARAALDKARHGLDRFRFTAADGREVDLAKMKGKVVLVDFWATWCGPCLEELPHVIETYRKYHAQGFEIIGVSFENSRLVTEADLPRLRQRDPGAKADTAEEAARKVEAARVNLLQFTAERGMPWPQHFDGRFWQNELGVHFGIRSIPTMFLIGRDGQLVTSNISGSHLEAEVRRLLGL